MIVAAVMSGVGAGAAHGRHMSEGAGGCVMLKYRPAHTCAHTKRHAHRHTDTKTHRHTQITKMYSVAI